MTMKQRWAKRAFIAGVSGLHGGVLRLSVDGQTQLFGTRQHAGGASSPLEAAIVVHDDAFFWRAVTASDIGLGESYMEGEWTSPDLVALIRLMLRNLPIVDRPAGTAGLVAAMKRLGATVARRLRDNTIAGSRRHIHRHYDLGNEFFRLFLDEQLMYSCAFYETGNETLEQAQQRKLDQICRKLDLTSADHVLEIGSGWGGFATWAATHYGCRVTTTTISSEQHRYVRDRILRLGDAGGRIQVLLQDYRELSGSFDKVVSIEMFEAVGLNHYDDYFKAVDRLLKPNGVMLLQTITVDDQYFPQYHRTPDWIEKYIFPGGELASVGEVVASMARTTSLSLYHAENIGTHYARTLHEWRARFHAQLERVRALGFDERFIRMWDLYLAYSEAAFLERHAGDFQLLLTKNYSRRVLFNEPWQSEGAEPVSDQTAVA